jgi:hypothetical protein
MKKLILLMMKRRRIKRVEQQILKRKKRKKRRIKRKRNPKMTRKTNKYPMLNRVKKFKMITLQLKQIKFSDVLELGIHHLNINFQIINSKAMVPTKYVNTKSQE